MSGNLLYHHSWWPLAVCPHAVIAGSPARNDSLCIKVMTILISPINDWPQSTTSTHHQPPINHHLTIIIAIYNYLSWSMAVNRYNDGLTIIIAIIHSSSAIINHQWTRSFVSHMGLWIRPRLATSFLRPISMGMVTAAFARMIDDGCYIVVVANNTGCQPIDQYWQQQWLLLTDYRWLWLNMGAY